MIKKRTNATGVNTNIALEPTAASSSTSNINNNIIINKREGGDSDNKRCEYRTRRNNQRNSHKNVILETYAQILLN